MQTKLIINADDFGYNKAINYGIIESHINGILTSATIMPNMQGFAHAIDLASQNSKLGVGVHMVLTCQKPLLDTHTHIIDENGNFYHITDYLKNPEKLTKDAFIEIEQEWTAQIEKVFQSGITPTHLDSHHHTHLLTDQTKQIAIRLAQKYNLPLRVFKTDTTIEIPKSIKQVTTFEAHFDEIGEAYMTNDQKQKYYNDLITKISQADTIEIMTHPGYIDQQIMTESRLNIQRVYEITALTDSSFSRAIKSNPNIKLSTYADL
ncbi:MAG: carbohydrate deacetylase [Culicoidibacterales bacterium]